MCALQDGRRDSEDGTMDPSWCIDVESHVAFAAVMLEYHAIDLWFPDQEPTDVDKRTGGQAGG